MFHRRKERRIVPPKGRKPPEAKPATHRQEDRRVPKSKLTVREETTAPLDLSKILGKREEREITILFFPFQQVIVSEKVYLKRNKSEENK